MYQLINSIKKDKSFSFEPIRIINQLNNQQPNQSNLSTIVNNNMEVSEVQKIILLAITAILFIVIFILIVVLKKFCSK